jgi:3-methyladenine DNA glycosylase AlkC
MVSSGTARLIRTPGLVALAILASLTLSRPVDAQTPSPSSAPQADPNDPSNLRPLAQDGSILSLPGGKKLMDDASTAVNAKNYTLAVKKLQESRQVFNQVSNFYQDLASSFSGVDNRVSDSNRKKALEAAEMRDQATYQLALVHRAQDQPELSVPLLVQIVRSQGPTRDLGKKAYQQLVELGFAEVPQGSSQSSSASPR